MQELKESSIKEDQGKAENIIWWLFKLNKHSDEALKKTANGIQVILVRSGMKTLKALQDKIGCAKGK